MRLVPRDAFRPRVAAVVILLSLIACPDNAFAQLPLLETIEQPGPFVRETFASPYGQALVTELGKSLRTSADPACLRAKSLTDQQLSDRGAELIVSWGTRAMEALATFFDVKAHEAKFAASAGPNAVAERVGLRENADVKRYLEIERPWRLVYQSRSGPPSVPWLGPDVCDHLADLAAAGAPGAVLVPVGFVSDHLEVLYDLDVKAAQAARRLGLPLARAATPGTHPHFVSMITELVGERAGDGPAPRTALGGMGPGPDSCPGGCCRPRPAARGTGRPGGAA